MKLRSTPTILSFRIVMLISVIVIAFSMCVYSYSLSWWLFGLFMHFCYGGLGITVGQHRLFSHRSFKVSLWKERVLAILGALSGAGSSIGWTTVHHAHHAYTDTPRDPHSPTNGLWKVISFDHTVDAINTLPAKKLYGDPFHRFIHTHYNLILFSWVLLLFLLGGWTLALFGFFIPSLGTTVGFMTVNLFGHKWGYRSFKTKDLSVNNPISALLAYGEWHNNHHAFPKMTTTSFKWWELDVSGLIIELIREDKNT